MRAAVVICTRNNSLSLARTLDSLALLDLADKGMWRVIVVDNGSTDNTPGVLAKYAGRFPLTIVHESRPGLSVARNAGVAALDGDIVLCTDDDAIVPSGWLENYLGAFRKHPDVSFMGGDVVPVLKGKDDAWGRAAVKAAPSAFARLMVGERDILILPGSPDSLLPFGVNMAFRVDALRQFRFDEALGRQPNGLNLSGEETALMSQMLRAGHSGLLLADNPVEHHIHPDRQNLEYIKRYYYAQGWLLADRSKASSGALHAVAVCGANLLKVALNLLAPRNAKSAIGIWLNRQHSHFAGRIDSWSA